MRFDSTTKIALPAVILLIGAALLLFLGCETAKAQTFSGGTFTLSQPYQAIHDEIMTGKYGEEWETVMQKELKEHLRNRLSEARESFREKATDAVALDDEQLDLLTPQEKQQVDQATRILRIAAERIKQRRDSIAAEEASKDVGALRPEYSITGPDGHRGVVHNPELIGANIGKGYVPPFDFFRGYEEGGGGGNDPSQSAGHAPGMGADLLKAMAITAGIAVVVVAILVYAGYGVYHSHFEER